MLHSADNITVAVAGFIADDGTGVASFAVLDVKVNTQTVGAMPYTGVISDFSLGVDGWSGPSIDRTTCATLGVVLGGHEVFGAGAFIQKTFTDVCSLVALESPT